MRHPLSPLIAGVCVCVCVLAGAAPESWAEEPPKEEPAGIFCRLTSAELRQRIGVVRADFIAAVVAVDELDDGYRYWFEKSPERLARLAEFVDFESRCCPFLNFEISLRSGAERVALSLTGRPGTKEMLQTLAASAAFDMSAALGGSERR